MELHRASSSSSYGFTVSARSDIHNNLYATICQSEHKREQNRNNSKILRHFKQNYSRCIEKSIFQLKNLVSTRGKTCDHHLGLCLWTTSCGGAPSLDRSSRSRACHGCACLIITRVRVLFKQEAKLSLG